MLTRWSASATYRSVAGCARSAASIARSWAAATAGAARRAAARPGWACRVRYRAAGRQVHLHGLGLRVGQAVATTGQRAGQADREGDGGRAERTAVSVTAVRAGRANGAASPMVTGRGSRQPAQQPVRGISAALQRSAPGRDRLDRAEPPGPDSGQQRAMPDQAAHRDRDGDIHPGRHGQGADPDRRSRSGRAEARPARCRARHRPGSRPGLAPRPGRRRRRPPGRA